MPRVKERNQSNSKSIRANFLDKIKSKLLMSDKVLSGCRETFRKQVPKKDRFYLSVFLFLAHFLLFSARYNLVSDVTLVLSNFSAANLSMRWKSYRKKVIGSKNYRLVTMFLSQNDGTSWTSFEVKHKFIFSRCLKHNWRTNVIKLFLKSEILKMTFPQFFKPKSGKMAEKTIV